MKKYITLLLLFVFAVSNADTITIPSGGIITLANTNELVVSFDRIPGLLGCRSAAVEIISCNVAGVKVTSAPATVADWTRVNNNAAGSKIPLAFCYSSTNPFQAAVSIRIKGTTGDVIRISYY